VSRGYQGFDCDCKACRSLTDEERAAKQERIRQARQRGGRTRAAQPSMQEARQKGFFVTCWEKGYGLWLKKRIRGQNELRRRNTAMRSLLSEKPAKRRRPMRGSPPPHQF
jgi:hypothetical protein